MNTAAPGPDWKLIARRRLIISSKIYPAGSQIPAGEVGRNFSALISSGLVWWAPPSTPVTAAATDLPPPPPPPKPKPSVMVIEKYPDDPVRNWELTRDRMLRLCGDNAALARDLLESHEGARQLYKLAQKVGVAEAKQKRRLQTLSPNDIGL
jgi:hypothetical protein